MGNSTVQIVSGVICAVLIVMLILRRRAKAR